MDVRARISAWVAFTALAVPAFASPAAYDYTEPTIVVTEQRSAEDEMINRQVVDALATDPSLSGRIGVQTSDREVELTGIVTSPGMWRQAERDAKSISGVRNVHNLLSTRIGGGRY